MYNNLLLVLCGQTLFSLRGVINFSISAPLTLILKAIMPLHKNRVWPHETNLLYFKMYIKLKAVYLIVMSVSQLCQHRSKRDLLDMKVESSETSEYIFISLNVPVFIHTSALKPMV